MLVLPEYKLRALMMQTWYLIIGIGTLLLVTTIVNNIAEAVERKAREKKLKILRLKRSVDNLTDFMEQFKNYDIPKEIEVLLQNEIFSRLIEIQTIDKSFNGIADLIAESKTDNTENIEQQEINDLSNMSEPELQKKLAQLRQLTKYLREIPFLAKESLKSKLDYYDILVIYRFEKLSHFYSKEARQALQNSDYKLEKKNMEQITGAIALSGYSSPRLAEINEQALLMIDEILQQQELFLLQQQEQDLENETDNEKDEERRS